MKHQGEGKHELLWAKKARPKAGGLQGGDSGGLVPEGVGAYRETPGASAAECQN